MDYDYVLDSMERRRQWLGKRDKDSHPHRNIFPEGEDSYESLQLSMLREFQCGRNDGFAIVDEHSPIADWGYFFNKTPTDE